MSKIPAESKARGEIGTKPIDDYLSEQVADPQIAAEAKQKYTKQDVKIDESKECFENYITNHIKKNFRYPKRAAKNNIEGDVFIQFEITKSGYFINFSTIGPNKILEDEAYRIMSRLPQVQPGEYLGKKVSVLYGLPISFRLN